MDRNWIFPRVRLIQLTKSMKLQVLVVPISVAVFSALYYFLLTNKHLLLQVPKVGYILHAIAGGHVPGFFNEDIFEEKYQNKWRGVNDVFAATPSKSGTTWLMNTLHHIRARGNPKPFREIYEEVRFGELVYYPGQSLEQRVEILRRTGKKYPFNIIKTHFPPRRSSFQTRCQVCHLCSEHCRRGCVHDNFWKQL
jgi:hypothetical protein